MTSINRKVTYWRDQTRTDVLVWVDFELTVLSKHYLCWLVLLELIDYWTDYYVVLEIVGWLLAQRTKPPWIYTRGCQHEKVAQIKALVMTTKYASNRRFDPLYSEGTDERYLNNLTGNILAIANPKAPIKPVLGVPKAHNPFELNLPNELPNGLVPNQINPNQVVFRLNTVILGLLARNPLDYC